MHIYMVYLWKGTRYICPRKIQWQVIRGTIHFTSYTRYSQTIEIPMCGNQGNQRKKKMLNFKMRLVDGREALFWGHRDVKLMALNKGLVMWILSILCLYLYDRCAFRLCLNLSLSIGRYRVCMYPQHITTMSTGNKIT